MMKPTKYDPTTAPDEDQTHIDGEEPKMHGYVFDGVSGDDAAYMHDIEVSERSYWYEKD